MRRIIRNLELVIALVFVVALSVACPKKETPGPAPEATPTATAEPTPIQQEAAVCSRKVAFGGGGTVMSYECKDVTGSIVACPEHPEALPDCKE